MELNNFETAAALLEGIMNPVVYRLRTTFKNASETFKEFSKKRHPNVKKWGEVEDLLTECAKDFKRYSELLAGASPPGVPSIIWVRKRLAALEMEPKLLPNLENHPGTTH